MREGWTIAKLGDVCHMIKRGIAPKYTKDGGICVINQKCVRDHSVNYELARRHDLEAKIVNQERYIQVGDVLVNSTGVGTLGRVAQIRNELPEPTTVDTHVTIVRPEPGKFFEDFFGYMLIMVENEIASSGEGTSGQTELARTTLQNKFDVSFPLSIPEQKRIVAILDDAFEGIGRAAANAEKNLANARELFESYLNAVFAQKGEGWIEKKLGSFGKVQTGSTPKTSEKDNFGNFIPFVKPADFLRDGSLVYEKDGLSEKGLRGSRLIKVGSVLMVCIGATIGKTGFSDKDVATNQQINSLTPTEDVSSKFVYYQMLTPGFQDKVISGSSQATLPIINKTKWSNLLISLPRAREEQDRIVAILDDLITETQRLGDVYQEKLTTLAELKQSILQKAFSGELTAQPDQALKEAVA